MRFGQFCGFLADEMDLQHSDFILAAEILFTIEPGESAGEGGVLLPDRNISLTDAALLVCLVVAMDQGCGDPTESAETAQEIAIMGQNMPGLLAAIEEGQDAILDVSRRFAAQVTVPASLTAKLSPMVRGGAVSHLRTV